ncbi:hypothetical protein WDU94_001141 [Cyamophila willieti]
MAEEGTDKPAAFSPAFASLLNRANTSAPSKPNFENKFQKVKPTFGLFAKLKTLNSDMPDQCQAQPKSAGTLDSPQPTKTAPNTPFANLINKRKETKPVPSLGSSTLETLSAKYLNTSQVAPKFGSSGSSADIICPVFKRNVSSPADQLHDIRPLQQSGLPTSPEIQIPHPGPGLGIAPDSSLDYGSPTSKFTFSPLPNKTVPLGDSPDSKLSSLGKLKDRYMKNSRVGPSCDSGSPHSPSLDDNKAKTFKFDLSSAVVARKHNVNIAASSGIPTTNVNLTPKRRTHDQTIVVDQLTCVLDARSLLYDPRQQTTTTRRKRMSAMGKVICKRWKAGTCENIPVRFPVRYHIPAFKFDTMSPDDEIESRFKRRR